MSLAQRMSFLHDEFQMIVIAFVWVIPHYLINLFSDTQYKRTINAIPNPPAMKLI